jgi:hypothetical protein
LFGYFNEDVLHDSSNINKAPWYGLVFFEMHVIYALRA